MRLSIVFPLFIYICPPLTHIGGIARKIPRTLGPGNLDLFNADNSVFFDGNGHSILNIIQELISQRVHNRHGHAVQPHRSQNRTGSSQRIDGFRKQHAGRLTLHGAGAVQNQAAGGRADGLRQAAFLSPNCSAFWKDASVFRPPWLTSAGAVTVPGATTRPLKVLIMPYAPFVIFSRI